MEPMQLSLAPQPRTHRRTALLSRNSAFTASVDGSINADNSSEALQHRRFAHPVLYASRQRSLSSAPREYGGNS